jgi:D-alanyl-D-alanine carboxypeptidase/D-alanyl-D-alanine-endopeptidase (penicillin-binding protein 4)
MRVRYLFLISCFLFSCSVSKQIAKQANTILLKDSAISTGHIGISIYEPATGKYWYNYQAEQFFIPASNTKLFSLYAGMKYLGDSLVGGRFETTNNSAITFEPSGDPTFLYSDFARQPVFELLKKYSSVNIVSPSYTDFVGSGWAWNDYKEGYMAQRNNFPIYGNTLKITLTNNELSFAPDYFRKYSILSGELKTGFLVDKPWDANKFSLINGRDKIKEIPFRPDIVTIQDLLSDTLKQRVAITWFSKRLGSIIHSQPSDSMFAMMMHRSDNFFAEQTLLMASNEKLGYMSDDKMIEHILKNDLADIPQKPRWIDGSGLSRYNLFTPKDFVYLLQKLKNDFGFERMKAILPTGGTGTLSSLYKKDSSYIFAKTGTLSNNAALSGYLITAKNKFLIFSILTNNFITGATPIRKAVEKFISNIRQRY